MSNVRAMRAEKRSGFVELVKTVGGALLIAFTLRTFAFEPFNIPSGSMKPTLLVGDYLFVSKFTYGYSRHSFPFSFPPFSGRIFGSEPERGDVVVFKTPADDRTDYIKRVIGLPGDRIQMIGGVLHINDEPVRLETDGQFYDHGRGASIDRLRETLPNGVSHLILDEYDGKLSHDETGVYEVPPGHFFAMGDNRDGSIDSRFGEVGFVPIENIVGRAEILFFSTDGGARLLDPLSWITSIRYHRLFDAVR